jgi:hypothetical protein
MDPSAAPPSSPFGWGTREWLNATLGRDFYLNSEEGTVMARFASVDATWEAYVNGFGPVIGGQIRFLTRFMFCSIPLRRKTRGARAKSNGSGAAHLTGRSRMHDHSD